MRASTRGSMLILTLAITVFTSVNRPAVAADPWMTTDAPDKYIFVGKGVWDIEAGQNISPTGAPKTWLGGETSKIVGSTDHVYIVPGAKFVSTTGIAPPGMITPLDGSGGAPLTLDGKPQTDSMNQNAFWANEDHRRVVFIQDGDYWRGEIDWSNPAKPAVVNRKKVSSVGAFTPINSPLLWWGNTLLVWGDFDKAKPIVKIDLVAGTTDEIPTYNALDRDIPQRAGNGSVSPNHCRVVKWSPSVIYSYDLRTGKPSSFANKYESLPNLRGADLFNQTKAYWPDDETAYVAMTIGYVCKLDFRNNKMEILAQPEMQNNHRIVSMLPSGRYADTVVSVGGGHGPAQAFKERYLLDVTNNQHIALPFDDQNFGVWLDDSKYLYFRDKGGLSAVGVWLYNRDDNSNKRLGGGQIDFQRMIYLPKKNMVVAVSQQNGAMLRKVNLDGSGIQDLGNCELAVITHMPERSVDLGLSGAATDLWKPVAIDTNAIAPTEAAEAPTGKIKLAELVKNESPENQQFADQAYDYAQANTQLTSYYDPVKFATIMLDAHKADPQTPLTTLVTKTNYSAAVDPDHIRQFGHDRAMGMMGGDGKITADQKPQIADKTGQLLHDDYAATPPPDIKNVETLFMKAFADAKATVLGTPTASQQQQQQSPQQKPQQPPAQNPVDTVDKHVNDASNNVHKTQNTVNKLKGIFGQ